MASPCRHHKPGPCANKPRRRGAPAPHNSSARQSGPGCCCCPRRGFHAPRMDGDGQEPRGSPQEATPAVTEKPQVPVVHGVECPHDRIPAAGPAGRAGVLVLAGNMNSHHVCKTVNPKTSGAPLCASRGTGTHINEQVLHGQRAGQLGDLVAKLVDVLKGSKANGGG